MPRFASATCFPQIRHADHVESQFLISQGLCSSAERWPFHIDIGSPVVCLDSNFFGSSHEDHSKLLANWLSESHMPHDPASEKSVS